MFKFRWQSLKDWFEQRFVEFTGLGEKRQEWQQQQEAAATTTAATKATAKATAKAAASTGPPTPQGGLWYSSVPSLPNGLIVAGFE